MKTRRMMRAVRSAALLLPLLCLFLALSACGTKNKTDGLAALSSEARAKRLLALVEASLAEADSYRIDSVLEAGLGVDGEGDSAKISESVIAVGIGVEGYAVHRERSVSCSLAGESASYTETSGYGRGMMYLSSDESGAGAPLRSSLPLSDYLAFEAEGTSASGDTVRLLALLNEKSARTLTSTAEADGSYTVTLTALSEEAMTALREVAASAADALGESAPSLLGARITLSISHALLPESAEIEFFFNQNGVASLSLRASLLFSRIGTATAPDTAEVDGYAEIADLRLPYRVEKELTRIATAESGAYRTTLREAITYGGGHLAREETADGTYRRAAGGLSLTLSESDGAYLRERSYASGLCLDRLLDFETGEVLGEQSRETTDAQISALLLRHLDPAAFSVARVLALDSRRAEDGVYVLTLAAPDLSDYTDVMSGQSGVLASASLTVTICEGRLTEMRYELTAVKGTQLRIELLKTVVYSN